MVKVIGADGREMDYGELQERAIDDRALERLARYEDDEAFGAVVGRRFRAARLDAVEPGLAVELQGWRPDQNVVILGAIGTGKTWAAAAMLRERWADGWTVAFKPVAAMFDALRPGGNETLAPLSAVRLLVLDDLGTHKPSEWTEERLYALVDERYRNELGTVVTSNVVHDVLEESVDGRVWDRLVNADTIRYKLGGQSRRQG